MKVLLTGSTGYIGRRLLPILVQAGHHVVCLVRDKRRFDWEDFSEDFLSRITVLEADLTRKTSLRNLPRDVDAAYYLVHSMSSNTRDFSAIESTSARNFVWALKETNAKQIVYLSGIVNDRDLSHHLLSRRNVENVLKTSRIPVTVLRAAIIVGSGSASFEIIRNLVEKLPVMVAPRWVSTRCQPISIRNVIEYLHAVLMDGRTFGKVYDIGGKEILTYKEMLYQFAAKRKLRRWIVSVPVLSPRLSSLWLVFITPSNYSLARNLVNSMKNEVVCRESTLQDLIPVNLLSYEESLEIAFQKISQKHVISSWTDSLASTIDKDFLNHVSVPEFGVLTDIRTFSFSRDPHEVLANIWSIGGSNGWYFGNWLWRFRGLIDKMIGGVGLRRGRRSDTELKVGDAVDFWRVLVADKRNGRLLLYAEMKLPGEAWLEFKIKPSEQSSELTQTATFRPLGLWGRIYWYVLVPFHGIIFPGMARAIVNR